MGPWTAQIQLALEELGLGPSTYGNGEVPVWSAAQQKFVPGSGGGGGGGLFWQASVPLNNTQIKALPTLANSQTLVAAPGANRLVLPLACTFLTNYPDQIAYDTINAAAVLVLGYGVNVNPEIVPFGGARPSAQFLGNSFDITTMSWFALQTDFDGSYFDAANATDKVLQLTINNQGDGDFTEGDAANTLTITTAYLVLDTSTGEFVPTT